MTEDQFAAIRRSLRGTGCFAFQKGEYYFLYREAQPRNVLVTKCKSLDSFQRKAAKAVRVKPA